MQERRKIIIVANSTWNIYNFRQNVLRILLQNNFDVVVAAPLDHYITYLHEFPSVRHVALRHLARKSLNPLHDLHFFVEIRRLYKRERPDLILHYTIKPNIYGGLAASSLRLTYQCVVTGLGYTFLREGFVNFVSRYLYKIAFKRSHKVIFENMDDRQLFHDLNIVDLAKTVSVKGCGINLQHFCPQKTSFSSPNRRIFGFIGRLLYDKGIREYVEAARLVKKSKPNVEFWIVGDIDRDNPSALKLDELQRWIDEKIVVYHGSTNDVRPFISKIDFLVCPSYREGLPRIVLEAMSMQKVIITTNVPGCRETVDEGQNGLLVEARNARDLADKMLKVNQLPVETLGKMAAYSRRKAETEFDQNTIAAHILSIIESAIA